jgi:hypothetical protein
VRPAWFLRCRDGVRQFLGTRRIHAKLSDLLAAVEAQSRRVSGLELSELRRSQVAPLVCVLVEAEHGDLPIQAPRIAYMGTAARANEAIVLKTQVTLRRVRVIVFADLEKVDVRGIFCGAKLASVALGSCPMATFDSCEPGVDIRVDARVRDQ